MWSVCSLSHVGLTLEGSWKPVFGFWIDYDHYSVTDYAKVSKQSPKDADICVRSDKQKSASIAFEILPYVTCKYWWHHHARQKFKCNATCSFVYQNVHKIGISLFLHWLCSAIDHNFMAEIDSYALIRFQEPKMSLKLLWKTKNIERLDVYHKESEENWTSCLTAVTLAAATSSLYKCDVLTIRCTKRKH